MVRTRLWFSASPTGALPVTSQPRMTSPHLALRVFQGLYLFLSRHFPFSSFPRSGISGDSLDGAACFFKDVCLPPCIFPAPDLARSSLPPRFGSTLRVGLLCLLWIISSFFTVMQGDPTQVLPPGMSDVCLSAPPKHFSCGQGTQGEVWPKHQPENI